MFSSSTLIGVIATTMMIFADQVRVAMAAEWTEMFVPYANDDGAIDDESFGEFGPYTRDDPLRQHLHLFKPPSDEPTPVYIWAHSNGAKASGITPEDMDNFAEAGWAVLSWESVTKVDGVEDTEVCFSDFDLVWEWMKENADVHNLDPSFVVVGGRSRGTVVSWQMAHSQKPEIKGIYMYNAFPKRTWNYGDSYPLDTVTTESPPTFFVYGPECPKPIEQDCLPSPDPTDGHNPKYGQLIVDRYVELGIGSEITLIDGLINAGYGVYDYFPSFAASLDESPTPPSPSPPPFSSPPAPQPTCLAELAETCSAAKSPRACKRCARNNFTDLKDAGCKRKIINGYCKRLKDARLLV